jgi:chaperonin GroEL
MQSGVDAAVSSIAGHSQRATVDNLFRIALTAAGDQRIAAAVVEAMRKAGKDGVITLQAGGSRSRPTVEAREGFRLDRGYLSETFITEVETKECLLENCRLLISDRRFSTLQQVLPILEQVAREREPLLIIADDVEGEALSTLVTNRLRGVLAVAAVKSPGFGDRRTHLLHDIAVLTGGKAITAEIGIDVAAIRRDDLGTADRVVVTKDNTTITGGHGEPSVIESHVRSLRGEIDRSNDSPDREKLQERLTNLAGSIATIRIGGAAGADIEDQFYRAASAMHATRAAIEEGCVYGGGAALLNAATKLRSLPLASEPEMEGAAVIAAALEAPFCALVESAGKSPELMLNKRRTLGVESVGFSPETGDLEDYATAGALDPAKLLAVAIEVGFSHALTILKTSAWSHSRPAMPNTAT